MAQDPILRPEAEPIASDKRYQALFEFLPDPAFVIDQESGRVLDVNLAAARLYGYSRAEMIGLTAEEWSAEPDETAKALRGVHDQTNARLHKRKNGAVFPAEISMSFVEVDGRKIVIGVVRDITERKLAEAALARQDRLASMGMVAAGVAHEINNPLTYVLYRIECLAQDLPKLADAAKRCAAVQDARAVAGGGCVVVRSSAFAEATHCARDALDGIHRIKDITMELGTFSRVDLVEQSIVDLNHAFECAAEMANNELKYRARLVKQLGPLPPVWATEGKLTQVLLNLLINAVHAIDEGDADNNRITLRTWAEGGDVFAEVADTGKGIPPENLERIFDPFFTTKPIGSGSGLGLAICRNLVAEFGGDISVASEVGKGARFVVRLPVRVPPLPQRRADSPAPALATSIRGRVLVVDDEEQLARVLVQILGDEHEVIVAHSGRAARALLEKDPTFDVVLCDVMMPDGNGMELHAWLAQADPALARRFVFMSGGAFMPKVADYVARAGVPRIDKPFDTAHLERLVSELVLSARKEPGSRRA